MSLSEMVFLALLGLMIFGPKKLATIVQQAGKTLARLKRMGSEFQSQVATEITLSPRSRPSGAPVDSLDTHLRAD